MKRSAIIFGILTALVLCFIWGQSLLPHDLSAGESGRLMGVLKPLLDPQGRVDEEVFHHLLRKAAHFTEYAALGFCMIGFVGSLNQRMRGLCIPISALSCALAAVIDECIQLFSFERGPRVTDVLLDSAGAVFGIALFLLFSRLFCFVSKQKNKK